MKTASKIGLVFLAGLMLCIAPGCKDDKDDPPPAPPKPAPCTDCLPPITTTGQNTFGCLVNGKLWLPKAGWMSPAVRLDFFNDGVNVISDNSDLNEGIAFYIRVVKDTGYFKFPDSNSIESSCIYLDDKLTFRYEAEPIQFGYIHFLKADYKEGLFSGTFAFDAYNKDGDTLHITEGRFDIHK